MKTEETNYISKPIDDGGPAFPSDNVFHEGSGQVSPGPNGMSLRDYFAAKALTQVVSLITVTKPDTINVVARLAYEIADAMLRARKDGAK